MSYKDHIKDLEQQILLLKEQVDFLTRKLYGTRSEKASSLSVEGQMSLFEEIENNADSYVKEPDLVAVEKHLRKKKYTGQKVIDHYRETYECRTCRKKGMPYMEKAPAPAAPVMHSLVSASTIVWLIHQKFELGIPLYCQEKEWADIGLCITYWYRIPCKYHRLRPLDVYRWRRREEE